MRIAAKSFRVILVKVACTRDKNYTCRLVVVTRPLLWDGGMAEDHGAPEAGQLPRAWTKDCRDRVAKERASNGTKERVHRASRLQCFSLGDDRSASGSGDVSLTIFIASLSCSKSLTSFTNRTFHFSGHPGFMAFERNGKFGRIQCQRSKESSSSSRGKRSIPLQDRESQSHPRELSVN